MQKIFIIPSLLLFFLFCKTDLKAQEKIIHSVEDLPDSWFDARINETENEEATEDIYEELLYLIENPVDLNSCTEEELEQLFFLTDFQIFSLLDYRRNYGIFFSLNELSLIPGFHPELIKKMNPFVYLSYSGMQNTKPISVIRSKALSRIQFHSPQKKGFDNSDSTERFRGNGFRELLKYDFSNKKIRGGLCLEKDEGEKFNPLTSNRPSGFISWWFEINNAGLFKKIITGDFRISSANGLVFGYGRNIKSTQIILSHKLPAVSKYSSSTENGFFRGLALDMKKGPFNGIFYLSRRLLDVNEEKDSGQDVFSSFRNQGLHRNLKELANHNNLIGKSCGILFTFHSDNLTAGYISQYIQFNKDYLFRIRPDRYSAKGLENKFFLQSIHYSFRKKDILLFGEFARSYRGKFSLIQCMSLDLNSLFTASFNYRYYHPEYISFYSSSFGERSATRNESGIYTGIEAYPFSFLKTGFYIDLYKFYWPGFNECAPSSGYDFIFKNQFYNKNGFEFLLLTKIERNHSAGEKPTEASPVKKMMPQKNYRIVLQSNWKPDGLFSFKNRLEIKKHIGNDEMINGFYLGQDINAEIIHEKLRLSARYVHFDIPEWPVRIYSWEPDVLYSFSSPLYYGRGSRICLLGRCRITEGITIWMKFAESHYTSQHESGSGIDYRCSEKFREWKIQLQWKLP